MRFILSAILVLGLSACVTSHEYTNQDIASSENIKTGSGMFLVRDPAVSKNSALRVYYHKPASFNKDSQIVFFMHGAPRTAKYSRDQGSYLAEKYNFLLIVPEFSKGQFPTDLEYNFGNVKSSNTTEADKKKWSLLVNDRVFSKVKSLTSTAQEKYNLFGFSAGCQFAHRQLLFAGANNINTTVCLNAGVYISPSTEMNSSFPYSLINAPVAASQIKNFLASDLYVLVGEDDRYADEGLPTKGGSLEQGNNRLERGFHFYSQGMKQAKKLNSSFGWSFVTVPNAGHIDNKNFEVGIPLLLEGKTSNSIKCIMGSPPHLHEHVTRCSPN